jgi:hypothetical protein
LKKRLAENPNAIGYIERSLVDGSVRSSRHERARAPLTRTRSGPRGIAQIPWTERASASSPSNWARSDSAI